ncbi:hypothetical protein KO528_10495 [Saccharophagus degradans]|uniref:hypothetical protein n=1 Tax=Saccharophagus degradans TaxID=86304 RepID=UPI001C095A3B|nr:hypothetical protein [Saccharophagus degradans]MBU2985779.1 hypothetical protein [Saccharophagus degradans]
MNNVHKPLIIAGHNSGIPVELNPVQAEFYRNLETQSRQGSYWASILIKDLQSLSSGHVKRNVFVTDGPADASFKNFEMILPGCRAKVMKCSNGKYLVYKMNLDVNYPELQSNGRKPGLHQVRKTNQEWTPKFKGNGQISNTPNPTIAISDGYSDINRAAIICAGDISETGLIGSQILPRQGFDMHYTPGKGIGGLKNIRQALHAATDINLYESAALLAKTMEMAKNTKDVIWVAQGGGSGVLTQAMSILKNKGVEFTNNKHYLYFSHPTTSFVRAQALAMDIGMKFDRNNLSIRTLNPNETIGGLNLGGDFIAAYQRKKRDPEYTALHLGVDALKGVHRNWQPISTTAGCAAAISAAVGTGGSALALPAVLTAATAMTGLGLTLFSSWLPESYRRLKQKL